MTAAESSVINDKLVAAIASLARAPRLLVACDYDGTIAPIVDDPMQAHPRRETVVALRALADLAQTEVAVVSGRALRDLATLSRLPAEIRLIGSHGSEFDVDFARKLDPHTFATRTALSAAATALAAELPGAFVELKPAGLAFHSRRMVDDEGVADRVAALADDYEGVFVRRGKQVVELSVVHTDKGEALNVVRSQIGATAVLYLGDDTTDEDAFATLSGPDVGVKVGNGDTIAVHRVADADGVTRLLAELAEARTRWLMGSGAVPIESHSLLSDLRTAAVVSSEARITWLCLPRIDSAAVFAELVGGPMAGYFSVGPRSGALPLEQNYGADTMLLTSTWSRMSVLDYLDASQGRTENSAGRSDLVRVVSGTDRAVIEFAPRLDFGRVATRLVVHEQGLEVTGSNDLLVLRSPGIEWELIDDGVNHTARAEVDLSEGDVVLELRWGTASVSSDGPAEIDRRKATDRYWADWARELDLPSIEPAFVQRSALILKSLVHGPTGAIVAAATTSLPEHIGGIRNWDYRYCWIRDGALTAQALAELGSFSEAMHFVDWVCGVADGHDGPARLAPLYLVTGHHLPPEAEIAELGGYAGSRPVRVGNAADRQIQLDVFGPLADLIWTLVDRGAPVSGAHWELMKGLVDVVAQRWHEPDHGIWEIRAAPRHHVYSRVMCWVTVDRAISTAVRIGAAVPEEWHELRDTIANDVLENGWRSDLGTFAAAYGRDDIDASVLSIGLWGLIDHRDPKFVSTVDAVEHALREGPTVRRYVGDDGLPGREGGFHLMTSWLIDAYALAGRRSDALALFSELIALAGPTGMMAEEYDPVQGRALGNVPQAYSHLGVIFNALRLDGRR
ncbi:MAG: trehalose 6-phosphate phosphatase [Candidatus Poriferisodalaceae bacterium]|jgi:trehalose 6-phosphate phosphatase